MKRIALGIEYLGQHYHGWQSQPHGQTVQDHLEAALSNLAGQKISVIAAGRTDRGVHAQGQVLHFDHDTNRPLSAWLRGANSLLPPDIAVLWARDVPAEFHARFSAIARRYRYLLLNRPTRPAILHGKIGWLHAPLDLNAMQEAANYLTGQHDFSSFRASECQAKTPIKTLETIKIEQVDDKFSFEFQADAFLHHMVRNLVGALLHIGQGKRAPEWMKTLLEAKNRSFAPATFMPDGLYLTGVAYPAHFQLPLPCFSIH